MKATAQAHANIALVKYWGKRDDARLLPEAPSLSVALDKLVTTTSVELGAGEDSFELDGRRHDPARARALLDAAPTTAESSFSAGPAFRNDAWRDQQIGRLAVAGDLADRPPWFR